MSYATAVAYFEQLPDGFASFPDCVAHASLLHKQRGRGTLDALDGLPPSLLPLLPILEDTTTSAGWLPEVVHVTTLLAVRDARFGETPDEENAFLAWLGQLNRDLLGGPSLAGALVARDPTDVLPRLPSFWATFHRGTPLSVEESSANHARLVLTHPPQLFHRINLESHRRTLALSLAMSRAVQPQIVMRSDVRGPEARTVFEVSWR